MPRRHTIAGAVSLALLAVVAAPDLAGGQALPESRQVANVGAFARLYGLVRWFHPSDRAAAAEWDRVAVDGIRSVRNAPTPEALRDSLQAVFAPLAPAVRVYLGGREPALPRLVPDDTAGLLVVAWQHHGVGLTRGSQYQSGRLNRPPPLRDAVGRLELTVPADSLRGRTVRVSAEVRLLASENGAGSVRLRLAGEEAAAVHGSVWRRDTLQTAVPADAATLTLGAVLEGLGEGQIRRLDVEMLDEADTWRPIELAGTAAAAGAGGALPPEWTVESRWSSWPTTMSTGSHGAGVLPPADGPGWFVSMHRKPPYEPFFPEHPVVGEATDAALGAGVRAWVPLALYSDRRGTLPRPTVPVSTCPGEAPRDDLGRAAVRLAGVVIAWNVFQHFYPYFDVVETDWNEVLPGTLRRALEDTGPRDFLRTLGSMLHHLKDGHADVFHPSLRERRGLPIRADWVEERLVVVAAETSAAQPGDVVLTLDGEDAGEVVDTIMNVLSGTERWRRHRALTHPFRGFGRGAPGSTARLTLLRGSDTLQVKLVRDFEGVPAEERPDDFAALEGGVRYVNLSRTSYPEIRAHATELAAAPGIVFDLRGYPRDRNVISHLIDEPVAGFQGLVPHFIYPDREDIVGWDDRFRWVFRPAEPRFPGPVAFLTDARAISFAEGVLSAVEAYRLGEIVGQATAGANGTVNPFALPGGVTVAWTGLKVLKEHGGQHHLVGVRPTVAVDRTIAGIRAGRDEYLEAALAAIEAAGAGRR